MPELQELFRVSRIQLLIWLSGSASRTLKPPNNQMEPSFEARSRVPSYAAHLAR